MELQTSLLKLLANIESMERNIDTKLEAVKDKINNLDDKVTSRIDHIEKQVDTHCDDEDIINEMLNDHDKKIIKAESYVDRIRALEEKYTILEKRVIEVENAPTKSKAKVITDFTGTFMNIAYVAIASGAVALIVFLIKNYVGK